jgi:hypothetical protein
MPTAEGFCFGLADCRMLIAESCFFRLADCRSPTADRQMLPAAFHNGRFASSRGYFLHRDYLPIVNHQRVIEVVDRRADVPGDQRQLLPNLRTQAQMMRETGRRERIDGTFPNMGRTELDGE